MTQYVPVVLVKEPPVKPKPRSRCNKCLLLLPALLLLLLPLLYPLLPVPHATARMADSKDSVAALSASLSTFTMDLYKALSKLDASGNLFFSPLSVMTALSMTLLGCRSNTHSQLAKVLSVKQDDEELQAAFADVISKYKAVVPEYELRTANMMYVSDQLELQQSFADSLTQHFQASAKVVDFGGQTEAVRQEINEAVEKETNSKIKELIPSGVLDALTRLVLVNAVYFKGLWVKPFDKAVTRDEPFYTSETDSVTVPMMRMNSEFNYMPRSDLGARVLGMPYKGSNLSLVIVLPDNKTGLAEVESKLTGIDLRELVKSGRSIKVEVALPRFKLEYSQNLKETLKELGAADLFTPGVSDMSGVGGKPGDLHVSHVLHKAFLEVNEEGSEAAAATAAIAMSRAMIRPIPPFVADHPFLFFLHDGAADITLFAGRYSRPVGATERDEL